MSTTADSAQLWITEKTRSAKEIQAVIDKLELRIDGWEGDDDKIQGSIEAVIYLQSHLDSLSTPISSDAQSESFKIDSSSLIPDAKPVELEKDVKQATFEALKSQIGKNLKL